MVARLKSYVQNTDQKMRKSRSNRKMLLRKDDKNDPDGKPDRWASVDDNTGGAMDDTTECQAQQPQNTTFTNASLHLGEVLEELLLGSKNPRYYSVTRNLWQKVRIRDSTFCRQWSSGSLCQSKFHHLGSHEFNPWWEKFEPNPGKMTPQNRKLSRAYESRDSVDITKIANGCEIEKLRSKY